MNLKLKSSLIIIMTLIIGMVLGGLIVDTFLKKDRIRDRIAHLRKPEGFVQRFEQIIEPDSAQREIIRDILKAHFDRVEKTSVHFREQMRVLNDSLRMELEPILTEQQKEKLRRRLHRFPPMRPESRNFPPPPKDDWDRPPK
jgi:hypothetical protein